MVGEPTRTDASCSPLKDVSDLSPNRPLQSPALDAPDGYERLLAEANEGGRRDALERLEAWMPDLDLRAVTADSGGQRPTLSRVDERLVHTLGGLGLVSAALRHDVAPPRLSLHADGETVQRTGLLIRRYDQFTTTSASVSATLSALAEGVMVLIDGVDQFLDPVVDLISDLERVLGGAGTVNLYVGGRNRSGFRPHWDDHEVFIIPLHGRKSWELRERPVPAPRKEVLATTDAETSVIEKLEVGPGHALHIPRGWPHVVTPLDDLAAHLTLGIRRLAWPEVLERVAELSVWSPEARGDLPDAAGGVGPLALEGAPDSVRTVVDVVLDHGGLGDALASWRARMKSRPVGDFAAAREALLDGGLAAATVRANYPGGFHLLAWDEPGDEVALAAGGLCFVLAHHAMPTMARLARGNPVAVADLHHACPQGAGCAEQLVRMLSTLGLIDFVAG